MSNLRTVDAAALQAYVRKFDMKLKSRMYVDFDTAKVVTPHENVKGQKILTNTETGTLLQKWKKEFEPLGDINFEPVKLETHLVKMDFEIIPIELHDSYLGEVRLGNVNPETMPFAEYVLADLLAKQNEEKEFAIWGGSRLATIPDQSPITDVITGYQTLCVDAATAGDITPVATGAITNANAIEKARDLYKTLHPAYQRTTIDAFVSYDHMIKLQENYQTLYGKYVGEQGTAMKFGVGIGGGGVNFRAHAGIQGDFMLMTPARNLHYGYASEGEAFRFFDEIRCVRVVSDMWMGAQIRMMDDRMLRINDQ